MDRRWTLIVVTLIMVLMVYTFLSMVLKKDRKKPVHTRMYRDYSDYGSKTSNDDDYDAESYTYASSAEARKIKKNFFSNVQEDTAKNYAIFMAAATKNLPKPDVLKPNGNPQYEEMLKLSRKPLPELQSGLVCFQKGEYEDALEKFEMALSKLDPMELKNRIQLHSLMAECHIKLKNDEAYIQNKVKQVRLERKYKKLIRETFSDLRNNMSSQDFMTTQEASRNLLQIRSAVAKLPSSPMVSEMLKKAELNLEVARKVSQ